MWWYSLLRQRFSSSHSRDEIVWPSRIPTTHWREQSRHWSHNFWKWTSKLARSKCSQLKPLCVRSHCLLWQPTALPMWMPLQNEQFAWSHVCRQWRWCSDTAQHAIRALLTCCAACKLSQNVLSRMVAHELRRQNLCPQCQQAFARIHVAKKNVII